MSAVDGLPERKTLETVKTITFVKSESQIAIAIAIGFAINIAMTIAMEYLF